MLTIKLIIFGCIILASIARGEGIFDGFSRCAQRENSWINLEFAVVCFLPVIVLVGLLFFVLAQAVNTPSSKRVFISDLVRFNGAKTETVTKAKNIRHLKPAQHAKSHASHKNATAKPAK